MPSKFDFISPDILLREVDESQLPAETADDGILIIGQSGRGPAMKPTRVSSLDDLYTVFGRPNSGKQSQGDISRLGNDALPTYGLYAAEAWLASETSPVTFMRLVGEDTSTTVKAGWNLGGASIASNAATAPTTAYGLWVCASGSTLEAKSGSLAAIFYTKGCSMALNGTQAATTGSLAVNTSSVGTFIVSNAADAGFKIDVTDGTDSTSFAFNMNPADPNFIRKVANTNPHHFVSSQVDDNSSLVLENKYFLGESFETEVFEVLNDQSSLASGKQFGVLLPLASGSVANNWVEKNMASAPAKTGYFFANYENPGTAFGDYVASTQPKLFRLVSLHEGEQFQKEYMAQVVIDKLATGSVDPYGSFSVNIVNKNLVLVESFSGCNLNPNSDNFIAKKIGDQNISYNSTKNKFIVSGDYENRSNYVYVEMAADYKTSKSSVPFGFYGPARPKTFHLHSGSTKPSLETDLVAYAIAARADTIHSGHDQAGFVDLEVQMTASMSWPTFRLTDSGSNNGQHYGRGKNLGVRHYRSTKLGFKPYKGDSLDYIDIAKKLPNSLDSFAAGANTEIAFYFSLDEVVQDAANPNKYYYLTGSMKAGDAYAKTNGQQALLDAGMNKIIAPFFGGFDGVDITFVDPFSSRQVLDGKTVAGHYAYKAVDKAIDSIKDSEQVSYEVVSMPGIWNSELVDTLLENTEERGDALAIVDLNSGYKGDHEYNSSTATAGSVSEAVSWANARDYNTSYGAAYYPEVVLGSPDDGLTVPASVAGIGAIASSEAASGAPWFAPAGFNRGGIKELGGLKGPKVKRAAETLTKAERDQLYQANVNPIANFPGEGPVVFGQKTLQQTPSALDRINVRRLMIYLKKRIGEVARTVLFDQNVNATWNRFKAGADPILSDARSRFGVSEYKLILDETTTTPDYQDRNIMYAKVFIKPAKAIEFIAIDFTITRSGIEF
jgi:hypothetical protein